MTSKMDLHRPTRKKINGWFTGSTHQDSSDVTEASKRLIKTVIRLGSAFILIVTIMVAVGIMIERIGICLSK